MALPPAIQSRGQFWVMLEDAKRRTNEMLEFDPERELMKVVLAQLNFIEECTKGGRNPTADEIERVNIGPIAVRNFEEEDPELTHWLSEISYAFKKTWKSLP